MSLMLQFLVSLLCCSYKNKYWNELYKMGCSPKCKSTLNIIMCYINSLLKFLHSFGNLVWVIHLLNQIYSFFLKVAVGKIIAPHNDQILKLPTTRNIYTTLLD